MSEKKRVQKPAKTEAAEKLLTIWKRITAGELKDDHQRPEPLDRKKTEEAHALFLRALPFVLGGKDRMDKATQDELDKALAVIRLSHNREGFKRGFTHTMRQHGDSRDWDEIYRAELIFDLLAPFNEVSTGNKCVIDFYLAVCCHCGKVFEKKQANAEYCSKYCVDQVFRTTKKK